MKLEKRRGDEEVKREESRIGRIQAREGEKERNNRWGGEEGEMQ